MADRGYQSHELQYDSVDRSHIDAKWQAGLVLDGDRGRWHPGCIDRSFDHCIGVIALLAAIEYIGCAVLEENFVFLLVRLHYLSPLLALGPHGRGAVCAGTAHLRSFGLCIHRSAVLRTHVIARALTL